MSFFDKFSSDMRSLIIRPAFPAVALALLCIVTYFPMLNNDFKLDDFTYIHQALHPKYSSTLDLFITSTNQHYNPLNVLLNDLSFKILGTQPVSLHLFNLLLFYMNCLLLYNITSLLIRAQGVALLIAGFFCLHPVNAEIVNQIVFSTVLFSAACVQWSVWQYDQFLLHRRKLNYFIALFSSLLASLTLETAWILPFYLVIWASLLRKVKLQTALLETAPFWAVSLSLFFIWQMVSHGISTSGDFIQKIAYLKMTWMTFTGSLLALCVWYFQKLLFPVNTIWMYGIPPLAPTQALTITCCTLVLLFVLFIFRKKLFPSSSYVFAGLWFLGGFIFLLPGSLAHPENGLIIEPYWFYVSSMGGFILVGLILHQLKQRMSRTFFMFLAIFLGAGLFYQTQVMNAVAKTEKSYSEYWMTISPNPIPLTALAKIAMQERNYPQAIAYYERYLKDFSTSPYANYWPWEIYTSIAAAYSDYGDLNAAKAWANKAHEANPRDPRPYIVLGGVYVHEKNMVQAEENFLTAIALDPKNLLAKLNLADVYLLTHQEPKAIPYLSQLSEATLVGNEKINVFAKLAALQFLYGTKNDSQATIARLLSQEPGPKSYFILAQAFAYFQIPEQSQSLLKLGLEKYPQDKELNSFAGHNLP